jgi:hypothetical protein
MTEHDIIALIASIDQTAAELARCFNHLPSEAKATVLQLEPALADVRRRLAKELRELDLTST